MATKKKRVIQWKEPNYINTILPHDLACSDLPRSFFKNGFYSCSACDDWHDIAIHGWGKKGGSQSELWSARRQCQRIKRGPKPLKIRVISGRRANEEQANICPEVSGIAIDLPSVEAVSEGSASTSPEYADANIHSSPVEIESEVIHNNSQRSDVKASAKAAANNTEIKRKDADAAVVLK
jgi:hypothetical protein